MAARDAAALGTDLRTVWEAPTTDARLKKRVVRTVILEVVAEIDDGAEPWLNLTNAARLLGVTTKTLRLAAEAGSIEGVHPLPDGPWIFACAELGKPPAQQLTQRARQNPKYPTGSHPDQQNLFTSEA
ncbi:hypothetical protein [Alloyangia pacifica]|uniref:hypothetical protein n=1 Tax=Alloyangia pacifica TaxID=311180 RepID=UPI0020C7E052|nr:hypothetical protein [Alloyangia pacifica]